MKPITSFQRWLHDHVPAYHLWCTLPFSAGMIRRGVLGHRGCRICGRRQIRKAAYGWAFNGHVPSPDFKFTSN